MGEKWVLLAVFLKKLCSSETLFLYSFQQNTAVAKKLYVEKQKFMKNSGLFLNMAKRCFLFVPFWGGFNVIFFRFVFVCLVELQKC